MGRLLVNLVSQFVQWPLPKWYCLKLMYLQGHSVNTVQQWIRSCWKECIQPRLFPGVIETIRWLQSVRAHIVLLSGTPRPLAEPLMDWLNIQDIICAEPEIQNGVYTGHLLSPHPQGPRKVTFAGDWLQAYGYKWDQVVALANHWNDRFLLDRADYPIVVHPDRRLWRYARRHAWFVVDDINNSAAIISNLS